jgi:hypothetical protein
MSALKEGPPGSNTSPAESFKRQRKNSNESGSGSKLPVNSLQKSIKPNNFNSVMEVIDEDREENKRSFAEDKKKE